MRQGEGRGIRGTGKNRRGFGTWKGQGSLDGQGEHSKAWTEDRETTGGTGGTGRGQEGGTRGLTGALRGGGARGCRKRIEDHRWTDKARIVGWRNKRNAC